MSVKNKYVIISKGAGFQPFKKTWYGKKYIGLHYEDRGDRMVYGSFESALMVCLNHYGEPDIILVGATRVLDEVKTSLVRLEMD